MSNNSGIIVSYTDLTGTIQKGIVRFADQNEEFGKRKKALVRLLNDDLTLKKDQDDKALFALKSIDLLVHIGYCD